MKLYWRYKKDGKWTWKPVDKHHAMVIHSLGYTPEMEEEE